LRADPASGQGEYRRHRDQNGEQSKADGEVLVLFTQCHNAIMSPPNSALITRAAEKCPNGRCKLLERLMHNKNAIFKGFISGFWIDQEAQLGPLSSRLTVEAFVGHAYYRGSPTATYSADG
jgi:hypothetical protein